nr:hypothetical protein Iba_chr01bCG5450 [Ipomoea batatas]
MEGLGPLYKGVFGNPENDFWKSFSGFLVFGKSESVAFFFGPTGFSLGSEKPVRDWFLSRETSRTGFSLGSEKPVRLVSPTGFSVGPLKATGTGRRPAEMAASRTALPIFPVQPFT